MADKMDISNLDNLQKEEIERMHDEVHIMFNKLLTEGTGAYTFRQLHHFHHALHNALIRAGGIHISPIDQLDKIQMLEADKTKKRIKEKKEELEEKNKEEFILLEYFKEEESIKNLWAIELKNKIFEFNANPHTQEILYSIKKDLDAKGKILDRGEFKILKDNENLLSVEFLGENLKGIYNFKRNGENSEMWKFSKDGVTEKLSEKFGVSLSNKEIKNIHFLSSNKIGASEIANLLSRPVQTVYSWIGKLSK